MWRFLVIRSRTRFPIPQYLKLLSELAIVVGQPVYQVAVLDHHVVQFVQCLFQVRELDFDLSEPLLQYL